MPHLDRRHALLGEEQVHGDARHVEHRLSYDWQSTIRRRRLCAGHGSAADKLIANERAWNLHGVVVVRNDRLVLERYFEGEDEARGRGLGKVSSTAETLHDMRSVSKSVVSLLYGIALEQGKVPPPEARCSPRFRRMPISPASRPERLTIHHALTMAMGTGGRAQFSYTIRHRRSPWTGRP